MHLFTTTGAGSVQNMGNRGNDQYSMNGNAVMYEPGKVLTFGGAISYDQSHTASNRSYVVTLNNNGASASQSGNLKQGRTLGNGVVLPSGEVVAVGGMPNSKIFSDDNARFAAEIWNPSNGQWKTVASMSQAHTYHSVAILMKDGRVWAAGGGLCGGCSVNHPNAQIYSPPYLYNSSGQLASRPVINNAPSTANYNSSISVQTNQGISEFVLMKMSSVTHSVNVEQRRIPVTSSSNGGNNYTVNIPSNSWVPPGDYFLFAFNNTGVPSVAKTIRIGGTDAPSTGGGSTAGGATITEGTYYIENRVSGKVLDVSRASTANGGNIHQYTYVGGQNQQFEIKSVGGGFYSLIAKHSNKVLDVAGGSLNLGTNVQQWTSNGTGAQQWKFENLGNGYYHIISKLTNNHYLDLDNASKANRANIKVWPNNGNFAQDWKLVLIANSRNLQQAVAPIKVYPNPTMVRP